MKILKPPAGDLDLLVSQINAFAQFIVAGEGAPTHTPDGPQIYFEVDGPGVHIYNGAWVAL